MAIPMAAFCHLMAPFQTGQVSKLQWLGATKRKLKPTRTTPTFKEFKYIVDKPGQVNSLFDIGEWDREITGTPWQQGWGCQQLALSQAAGQRGEETTLVSFVTGKVTVQLGICVAMSGLDLSIMGPMSLILKCGMLLN